MTQEIKKAIADLKKQDAELAKAAEEHIESFSRPLVESGKFDKADKFLLAMEKRSLDSYISGYTRAMEYSNDKLSCLLE